MFRLATGCMLLAAAFAPTPAMAETQDGSKGRNYAFLVGCSKYIKTQFRDLPYTGNDVLGFREALLKTGFTADHVVVLQNAANDQPQRYLPEKAKILAELDLLMEGLREQDALVIALSGHGMQWKGDPVSYFVPVDGKIEDKSSLIALSGKNGLYERLKKCKAQVKLLLVNASRDDPTTNIDYAEANARLNQELKAAPQGIVALFSCQAGQKSYYDPDRKISLFFYHVIKAWNGEYTADSPLPLERFFDLVTTKTKMDANKTFNVTQTPSVQREYAGKWVIGKSGFGETLGSGKGNNYALLVGCSKYIAKEFRDLPYSGNDVMGFREALLKTGFPDDHVVVLQDTAKNQALRYLPEKVRILKELDVLLQDLGEHDTLVIALSGHGIQLKGDPVSYFVPMDGKVEDKSTLIALTGKYGLYERLRTCKAQYKLLIVNTSHDDPAVRVEFASRNGKFADQDPKAPPGGIAAIFACEAGQKTYNDPDQKMSLFFHHLSRAWKGYYNGAAELTLQRLFDQVTVKTTLDADKSLYAAQNPSFQQEYAGRWVMTTAEGAAKVLENEQLTASEFAEFSRLLLISWNKANAWLSQHAAARLPGWREAASDRLPEAIVLLGECLESGKVLPRDNVEAVKWYRKAADQGDAWGQAHLGRMYSYGIGVPRDYAEALKWLRLAADQGNAAGQMDLGRMYAEGHGVAKNEVEAAKWYRLAAEQGHIEGQITIGRMYQNGEGVGKDYAEAVKWYRLAADYGNSWAQNWLGVMFDNGHGVAKDEIEAIKWFRKAAALGNAAGQNNLGWMYENGRGVNKDTFEAIKWYRQTAENGDAWGQNKLGVMYNLGRGVPKNQVEAVKWFRKSAAQDYADGQHNLGVMYASGHGIANDDAHAVKWFRLAAAQGHAAAQNNLGVMYKEGRGVVKDEIEAVKWFRKAGEQGHASAQHNLGLMYANGRGVAKDDVEAVKWYCKAADQGEAAAQNSLGTMYADGLGIAKDQVEAVKWFRKASEQWYASAQNNLGWMYAHGRGVARDDVEAVNWYRKAADQGDAGAQYNLGWMYENGWGVRADLEEAIRWFRLASQGGDQNATNALRRLGRE